VLPRCVQHEVLRGLHDEVGHPGIERTTRLIRERLFWPGLSTDVKSWMKKYFRCLHRTNNVQRAPLVIGQTTYHLELVCMVFLTLEPSRGVGNVLVITDYYTNTEYQPGSTRTKVQTSRVRLSVRCAS